MPTRFHLALGITVLSTGAQIANAERVIRFPEQSVGNISVRPESPSGFRYAPSDASIREGWSPFAPAEGDVIVPDNVVVLLQAARDTSADLAWVENLAADAADALFSYKLLIDDSSVRQLSYLTGLRSLSLEGSKITSGAAPWIVRLTKLQHLSLNSTRIDDETMTAMAALPE